MIPCPICGSESSVTETRRVTGGQARRRRICDNHECRAKFTTVEIHADLVKVPRFQDATLEKILKLAQRALKQDKEGTRDE